MKYLDEPGICLKDVVLNQSQIYGSALLGCMTYVLHYAPDNASLIIRLVLESVHASYRTALVDRQNRAQDSAKYRALNPSGLIPVLETPQGPVFETGAILLWLSERHEGPGPRIENPQRGAWLTWLFYVANTLHPALRQTFYPSKYIGPDLALQDALRRGLQSHITASFKQLDHLAAQGRVLGLTDPGALDFYIAACLRWQALYPSDTDRSWFDIADTPALMQICKRVEATPACDTLIAAEGLGPTPFSNPAYPDPPEGSAT